MGVHEPHEQLPRFDARQILKDGCEECEHRGRDVLLALGHLDPNNFARAWRRAFAPESERGQISRAEKPLLDTLYAVQVQLERFGVPMGVLPSRPPF